MATRVVYKIWQFVPYTKYGNSCQNATSWLVYIGGSLILLPTLGAPSSNSKIDLPLLQARGSLVHPATSKTSPWALK